MDITLASDTEKVVREKVASGEYATVSDVVNEALRLLATEEKFLQLSDEELRREIAIGIEEAERGECKT